MKWRDDDLRIAAAVVLACPAYSVAMELNPPAASVHPVGLNTLHHNSQEVVVRLSRYLLIALFTVAMGGARAETKMFRTVPNDPKNVVQFTSKATLESVVGHTSSVIGHMNLNFDSVTTTTDAQFDVDLNSLDTGIGMRNNDMRKDFLETAKYPSATFKLTRFVSSDKPGLQPGETAHAVVEGDFTVHGVAKSYQIPVTITFAKGDRSSKMRLSGGTGDILAIDGEWTVKLADHKITRPQMLFMRLAEEQHVSISIALTDVPPPEKH